MSYKGKSKGKPVGSGYPEECFRNPFNAEIDKQYEAGENAKSLVSPTEVTVTGAGIAIHENTYNAYWEDGK